MDIDNKPAARLLTKRELHKCAYPCRDRRKYILRGVYLYIFSLAILLSAKEIHEKNFSSGLFLLLFLFFPLFIWLLINTVNLYMDYKFLRYIMACMKNEQEFRLWDKIENRGGRIHWRILRVPTVYFMLAKLLIDTKNQTYVETGEKMRNLAIEADSRLSAISNSKEATLLAEKRMIEGAFLRPLYLLDSHNVKLSTIRISIAIIFIFLLLGAIQLIKALSQLLR